MAGYLNTKHEVSLPVAGENVSLQESGRRRGSFISAPPRRLEGTKERHARTKVQVTYDTESHEVRIALPGNLDGSLFGEGEYTLEVLSRKLSRVKLNERDPETTQAAELQGTTE